MFPLFAALGGVLAPGAAQADVSSWLYVGGGASDLGDTEMPGLLQLDSGLGSSPDAPLIVGGLGRMQAHFGEGVDLGLLVRTTHRSFVVGGWGAAIDLGGYQRWWGQGSTGGMATLVLGAPWGITAAIGGALGSNDAQTVTATLGIDFARLTVHRQSGLSWFPNPRPYDPSAE